MYHTSSGRQNRHGCLRGYCPSDAINGPERRFAYRLRSSVVPSRGESEVQEIEPVDRACHDEAHNGATHGINIRNSPQVALSSYLHGRFCASYAVMNDANLKV